MNTDLREERDLNEIAEANKRTVFRISRDFSRSVSLFPFKRSEGAHADWYMYVGN